MCDACEAGDPCWACGINEDIEEIKALLESARARVDAYWNAKDDFEHDIKELFGQFISPEEFEKKWRPRLRVLKTEKYPYNQKWYPYINMDDCPRLSTCWNCSRKSCPVVDKAKVRYSEF